MSTRHTAHAGAFTRQGSEVNSVGSTMSAISQHDNTYLPLEIKWDADRGRLLDTRGTSHDEAGGRLTLSSAKPSLSNRTILLPSPPSSPPAPLSLRREIEVLTTVRNENITRNKNSHQQQHGEAQVQHIALELHLTLEVPRKNWGTM